MLPSFWQIIISIVAKPQHNFYKSSICAKELLRMHLILCLFFLSQICSLFYLFSFTETGKTIAPTPAMLTTELARTLQAYSCPYYCFNCHHLWPVASSQPHHLPCQPQTYPTEITSYARLQHAPHPCPSGLETYILTLRRHTWDKELLIAQYSI